MDAFPKIYMIDTNFIDRPFARTIRPAPRGRCRHDSLRQHPRRGTDDGGRSCLGRVPWRACPFSQVPSGRDPSRERCLPLALARATVPSTPPTTPVASGAAASAEPIASPSRRYVSPCPAISLASVTTPLRRHARDFARHLMTDSSSPTGSGSILPLPARQVISLLTSGARSLASALARPEARSPSGAGRSHLDAARPSAVVTGALGLPALPAFKTCQALVV